MRQAYDDLKTEMEHWKATAEHTKREANQATSILQDVIKQEQEARSQERQYAESKHQEIVDRVGQESQARMRQMVAEQDAANAKVRLEPGEAPDGVRGCREPEALALQASSGEEQQGSFQLGKSGLQKEHARQAVGEVCQSPIKSRHGERKVEGTC